MRKDTEGSPVRVRYGCHECEVWLKFIVIMGTMASQITNLTIVYSTVFHALFKENIKAPRHWPLCGEFTGDR